MKLKSIFSALAWATLVSTSSINSPILNRLWAGIDNTPISGGSPVQLCDESEPQLLTIDYIKTLPTKPERGKNLTVIAGGYVSKQIPEKSYVYVEVKYGYIKLVQEYFDLCEQLGNVDLECPVNKGYLSISKEVEIPQEVPPGKYLVTARAYTLADELITCLTANVEFP